MKTDSAPIGSIFIICVSFIYPISIYLYINKNRFRLESDAQEHKIFIRMHAKVFKNIRHYRMERLGLGFTLIVHFRKLAYSALLVFLIHYSGP